MFTWLRKNSSQQKTPATSPSGIPLSLVLAFLAPVLSLLAGWSINSIWGVEGNQRLSVGTSSSVVRQLRSDAEIPLGFSLLLQRRVDDYGPAGLRVAVRDRTTGAVLGQLELREGQKAVQVPGRDLWIQCDFFDEETGNLYVRARTRDSSGHLAFSIGSEPRHEVEFARYSLLLMAYQLPAEDVRVRAKLAVIEGKDVTLETWLERNAEIRWRGVRLFLADWGKHPDGTPFVMIHAEKHPGNLFFWLAPFLLALAAALLIRRKRGASKVRFKSAAERFPPRHHHLAFATVGFLLALAMLEGGARIIERARNTLHPGQNPFVDLRNSAPLFEPAEENGQQVYRRSSHHRLVLGNQSFLQIKPSNGYRVFIVGGSAAAGWPYEIGEYNTAEFLRKKLSKLFPDRSVEVIVAAGGTYGSHRVKSLFDEIVKYQPDLVVIYSGNNEFLENFVYQRQLPAVPWKYSALARLGYDVYSGLNSFKPSYSVDNYTLADQTSNRIAFAFGKSSQYRKDVGQFQEVLAHYRYNIESMVSSCLEQQVDVMLLNVPVNLKDWIPNASQHTAGISGSSLASWQKSFREGVLHLERGDYDKAAEFLKSAAAIDDEHAETHYYLGVALHRLGDLKGAKASYLRALERDAYPFRALPQFQDTLHDIAKRHGVPLIDIVGALERKAADGIIGLDVLLDYVHPTEESMETIAHAVVDAMEREGMLPGKPAVSVNEVRLSASHEFRPAIEAEAIEALYRQYLIMRQYDKMNSIYQRYISTMEEALSRDPGLEAFCRRGINIVNTLQPIIESYRALLRAEKLGLLEQEYSRSEAQAIYERYVDMIQALEAPDMSRESFRMQVPSLEYRGTRN